MFWDHLWNYPLVISISDDDGNGYYYLKLLGFLVVPWGNIMFFWRQIFNLVVYFPFFFLQKKWNIWWFFNVKVHLNFKNKAKKISAGFLVHTRKCNLIRHYLLLSRYLFGAEQIKRAWGTIGESTVHYIWQISEINNYIDEVARKVDLWSFFLFLKRSQILHFILAKEFSHFSHFSTIWWRGSQSHRTLYLVKMNRAYCLCDLYQYEVKKESQSKNLRRGGGIVAKLHYAWSHLAPATLQLSSTTTTTSLWKKRLHQRRLVS